MADYKPPTGRLVLLCLLGVIAIMGLSMWETCHEQKGAAHVQGR